MPSVYDVPLVMLDGRATTFGEFAGRAVLVVNVASKCGLTPQYASLEKIAEDYADRGLTVLGVPCNQFRGQEPGTNDEIAEFCSMTYGVTFPLTDKVDVNGADRHPLFDLLSAARRRGRSRRRRDLELREVGRLTDGRRRRTLPPAHPSRRPRRHRRDRGGPPRELTGFRARAW